MATAATSRNEPYAVRRNDHPRRAGRPSGHAAGFPSRCDVRDRGRHRIGHGAGLLRAQTEQVLENPERDRADAGTAAASTVPGTVAVPHRIDGLRENAFRHGPPDTAVKTCERLPRPL